jgi:hypothetical protein
MGTIADAAPAAAGTPPSAPAPAGAPRSSVGARSRAREESLTETFIILFCIAAVLGVAAGGARPLLPALCCRGRRYEPVIGEGNHEVSHMPTLTP